MNAAEQKDLVKETGASRCPVCGAEMKAGAAICSICGYRDDNARKQAVPSFSDRSSLQKDLVKETKEAPASLCPHCGAKIKENIKFCSICGKEIGDARNQAVSPFSHSSSFAKGLPQWSLEPPQVLVRRR